MILQGFQRFKVDTKTKIESVQSDEKRQHSKGMKGVLVEKEEMQDKEEEIELQLDPEWPIRK